MKNKWETKTFRELGEVFNGNSINKNKKKIYFEGLDKGTPYIGTKNVSFDHKVEYESGVKIPDDKRDGFKLAPSNAVLVCAEGGSAGRKIAYTNREVYFGNKLFAICPASPTNSRFVFYYCLSIDFALAFKNAMAGLIGGVSLNKFKNLSVPIPPPSEQKRIVAILDEVFKKTAKAKENAEKNLQNARELFESYLQSVFANPGDGWKQKKLGDVCENVEYGTSVKSQKTGKIPVLRMGNIQDGRLDWYDLVYTSDDKEIQKYTLRKNDILFNRTNSEELVGKTAIYKGERPAIFAGYLIRINIKKDLIDPDFLNIILNSKKLREYGFSVMTSSVNQANISGSKLKEYLVIFPPLPEQKRIVAKLDTLSAKTKKLEALYQQKLNDLEELKKSILQKAFNGELIGVQL